MDNERPRSLAFINAADEKEVTLTFGYLGGEPTAALFHGDKLILIPVTVLATAISSGWEDDYSILCPVLKDDSECPDCVEEGGEHVAEA